MIEHVHALIQFHFGGGHSVPNAAWDHITNNAVDVDKCEELASDKENALVDLAETLQQKLLAKEFLLGVWLRIVEDEDGGTFQPVRHVFWAEPIPPVDADGH